MKITKKEYDAILSEALDRFDWEYEDDEFLIVRDINTDKLYKVPLDGYIENIPEVEEKIVEKVIKETIWVEVKNKQE